MMTIVIVDDSINRCRRIENALKEMGIESITFHALEPAITFLKTRVVDGIVTDREYPIYEGDLTSKNSKAGEILLNWLKCQDKKIPVLGNSTCDFHTDYLYYRGRMSGFYHSKIFEEFICSIKDHN